MKPHPILRPEFLSGLGIVDWGYTEKSEPLSFDKYLAWVDSNQAGELTYLTDHRRDLRSDLKNIYPQFHSSLVFLFTYMPAKKWLLDHKQYELAAYTLGFEGEDYHYQLKQRLEEIYLELKKSLPDLESFQTLDIQPVLERDLAYRAGLGWIGKNSMLISRREGSYFIIGSLLLNQKLPIAADAPDTDHCGQCNACVEACPTDAIDPHTRTLKAMQCISTFTIETMKEATAPSGMEQSRGEIFGCDICQDVCPWNHKPLARVTGVLKLQEKYHFIKDWFFAMPKIELFKMMENESNRGLRKKLQGTPFDRPGRVGWLKNLKTYLGIH